jgi:type IV pilus assembly protein PilV
MSMFGFQRAAGFTLIEVLVSTIILAIGLLGLASMQTLALKDNRDAFFYSQASSLAYEMSDRMKVNASVWQGAVPTAASICTSTDNCNTVTGCTPAAMAAYDYCAWKANVVSRIGTTATATVAVSPSGSVCTGDATKRCLTISWPRNNLTLSASNTFQLEIQP